MFRAYAPPPAAMLIDGRELAKLGPVQADVCVIGAGPAGLSVALELDSTGLSVCVLESGGEAGLPSGGVEGSADSELHPSDHLAEAHGTGIGGTANGWVIDVGAGESFARYAWPDDIDFRSRPPLRDAGWPFTGEALDPYLGRAAAACGVDERNFSLDGQPSALRLEDDGLATKLFAFGPASVFTREARRRLAELPDDDAGGPLDRDGADVGSRRRAGDDRRRQHRREHIAGERAPGRARRRLDGERPATPLRR